MGLAPGARFGAFEVRERLGSGGMGEVFRARDTRLDRDVALKVLPPGATNRDFVERFEREARALAALNHPNIASIYDTVEIEGVRALVLELVDGDTLAGRLAGGAMPLREASAIAKTIAEALDVAHERGLVHRDLKPANIKISRAGDVKLLDFGIARMLVDGDRNETVTQLNTEPGMVIGTAAYMSPEQARGLAVDKRTDVWAFGCVLFEMLTGRAAFGGPTASDSIARTLTFDPDWSLLPSHTPPDILRLLQRCLQKDPKQRLRGLGGLELLFEQPREATAASTRSSRAALAAAVFFGVTAVAIGGIWWSRERAPAMVAATPVRFEIPPSIRVGESGSFALSPDGSRFVFVGTGADGRFRMWERSLASLETRAISGSEGEVAANSTVFWSPDGRSVGFYSDGAVRKINRDGGTAEIVCRVSGVSVGGSWNRTGTIVVGNTAGGLVSCPAAGGEPTPVTRSGPSDQRDPSGGLHLFPVFLRDGQRLLYLRVSRTEPARNGLYVADLRVAPDQQDQTRLVETGFSAKYTVADNGSEHILFVRNHNVWSVPFDSGRVATTGEAVQIAASVYTFRDGAAFDARGGVFVYRGGAPDYQIVMRNRGGEVVSRVGDPGSFAGIALSPDANRVALTRENKLNRSDQDLWIVDIARNTTARFTSDSFPESVPAWSADGQSLLFAVGHDDADIRLRPLNGVGERTIMSNSTLNGRVRVNPLLATFSPSGDGRWMTLTMDTRGPGRSDIWIMRLDEPQPPLPLLEQEFDQRQAVFAPDQKWLAYVSNESGIDEVLIRRLTWTAGSPPAIGTPIPVSRGGGRSPRWRGDGRELYYQSLKGEVAAVAVSDAAIGDATPLFMAPGALAEWDVTADGQRFFLAQPIENYDLPFTVVMNWLSSIRN
jgi:Tol biopolymer transport system component